MEDEIIYPGEEHQWPWSRSTGSGYPKCHVLAQQQFPKLSVVTEQRKLGIKALAELKYSGRKIG